MDFRLPEYRREVFHRFYSFHLRYASHPGGVYYVLPHLADHYNWDDEQRAWAAWINGNCQNPVMTLLLMEASHHTLDHAENAIALWQGAFPRMLWDTDRRHQKGVFGNATRLYAELMRRAGGQVVYWRRAAEGGWPGVWAAATALPHLGRLSAWSYLEYLRILGLPIPDADTLLLHDRAGSRSHRNGLLFILGRDNEMHWRLNPGFNGTYSHATIAGLETEGARLLSEARTRNPGHPHVGYLTLESALCTYKSWHLPRRRYPGVYNDLLHGRLLWGQTRWGDRFAPIWQARHAALPAHLRLEDTPTDPGCTAVKQNHYLETGEVIMMDRDWPCFRNSFNAGVRDGAYGLRKDPR
jgi:hypothetical protein